MVGKNGQDCLLKVSKTFSLFVPKIEALNNCTHACPGRSGPEPLILSEEEREERFSPQL